MAGFYLMKQNVSDYNFNNVQKFHAQSLLTRLTETRQRATSPKKIERLNIRIDRVTAMLAAIKLGNP